MFLILLMLIFDIWIPYSYTSILGYKYFLILINYSRFIWVILVKFKAKTRIHLINFISFIETQFSPKLECLRSDTRILSNKSPYQIL